MHSLVVLSVPTAEGERFAILQPDDGQRLRPFQQRLSGLNWLREFDEYISRTRTLFTEEEIRAALAQAGASATHVDRELQRARRQRACNEQTVWERSPSRRVANGSNESNDS